MPQLVPFNHDWPCYARLHGRHRQRADCSREERDRGEYIQSPFYVGVTLSSSDIPGMILRHLDVLKLKEHHMLDPPQAGDPQYTMTHTHGRHWVAWQETWLNGLEALDAGAEIYAVLTKSFKKKLQNTAAYEAKEACDVSPSLLTPMSTFAIGCISEMAKLPRQACHGMTSRRVRASFWH